MKSKEGPLRLKKKIAFEIYEAGTYFIIYDIRTIRFLFENKKLNV